MFRSIRAGVLIYALGLAAMPFQASHAATKISVGYIPAADFLPNFVALDKGIYEKAGLEVQLIPIPLATNVPAALLSQSVQIGMTTTPIFLQARENGIDLAAIAGLSRDSRANPMLSLVARAGSGIKEAKDLEGKKVAVPGLNSLFDTALRKWISTHGGDPKKVTFVETKMPVLADVLRSGSVDAITVIDPFRAKAIADGTGVKVADYLADLRDNEIMAFWIVARDWGQKNRAVVDDYQRAMSEAIAFIHDHPDEARQIGTKFLKVPMPEKLPTWSTTLAPTDFEFQAGMEHELGLLKNPVDAKEVILK